MTTLVLLILGLALALVFITYMLQRCADDRPQGLKKLPGPEGLPFIGSILDLPERCSWLKFAEWAQEYGPIYQVNLAGTNHVWISRDRVAHDLLCRRSAIYSARPHIPALKHDNRSSDQYQPLMSTTPIWARQRKFTKQIMDKSHKEGYYEFPELESIRLLHELMQEPDQYKEHLESFVARVTSRLAFGTPNGSDELKQRARELLLAVSPYGSLSNRLPFLMSLPSWLSPPKAWELRRNRTEQKFFQIMQEESSNPDRSWTQMFLKNRTSLGISSDLEGAYAVGMHGIAGALTIAAPMQSFCLAIVHHPEFQPILHEEIDRVVGNDRLPRQDDMEAMPVLRAFIRETMRWRPAVPTGIPHALTQNDVYERYHIPKDSVCHPLEWEISRDPEVFLKPDEWNPMRWLEPAYPTYQEPLSKYPTITGYSQFGYGKRVCQGQGVVEADMFVALGSVAWLFSMHREAHVEVNSGEQTHRETISEHSTGSKSKLTMHGNDSAISIASSGSCDSSKTKDSAISMGRHCSPASATRSEDRELEDLDPHYPSCWLLEADAARREQEEEADTLTDPWVKVERVTSEGPSNHNSEDDPTLNYSSLLIAKPLPFKFDLRVRDQARADVVARLWSEHKSKGDFEDARVFWEGGVNGNAECGWGKT